MKKNFVENLAAMLAAINISVIVAIVVTWILYTFFPQGPVRVIVGLIQIQVDPVTSTLFRQTKAQVDTLELFFVTPVSMLTLGLVLGRGLGDSDGASRLYSKAAITSLVALLGLVGFVWYFKLKAEKFHLNQYDLTPSVIISQVFAFIFWIGMAVLGSEIGRRFHKVLSAESIGKNDSGTGKAAVLPRDLRGFNWGGYLLSFFWSVANDLPWYGPVCSLLGVIWIVALVFASRTPRALPLVAPMLGVALLVALVFGFKGNEWAWQRRKWSSVEHFIRVQAAWCMWGFFLIDAGCIAGLFQLSSMSTF